MVPTEHEAVLSRAQAECMGSMPMTLALGVASHRHQRTEAGEECRETPEGSQRAQALRRDRTPGTQKLVCDTRASLTANTGWEGKASHRQLEGGTELILSAQWGTAVREPGNSLKTTQALHFLLLWPDTIQGKKNYHAIEPKWAKREEISPARRRGFLIQRELLMHLPYPAKS